MLNKAKRQAGTSLIEVLVTLVVLAIGVFGLAQLHANSIKSNQSAYYRSQATLLAYDIGERMRANRVAALKGDYAVDFPQSNSNNTVSGSRAEQDKAEWLNQLAQTLPEGTGKVSSDNGLMIIEVRWDDTRAELGSDSTQSDAAEQTFVYRTKI